MGGEGGGGGGGGGGWAEELCEVHVAREHESGGGACLGEQREQPGLAHGEVAPRLDERVAREELHR